MSETGIDKKLAKSLMDIHAILLRPDQPFTWASGWHSPIYCDNRRILSHPELRSQVAGWLAEKAMELYPEAEVVAGVATGAIAHGVLAADRMAKPFVYVRPKPKDHGTGSQIEGELQPGKKVVVIEDLISTGMSSLAAVKALREAGADVLGMVAIFTYGFDLAAQWNSPPSRTTAHLWKPQAKPDISLQKPKTFFMSGEKIRQSGESKRLNK